MNVLAIIPARGGSQGIKDKNLVNILGKSLVEWAYFIGSQCNQINRVIVSTDSQIIASHVKSFGGDAPFIRPARLAQADTPDGPVFLHALEWLTENDGYEPDLIVSLRPTFPCRSVSQIDKAVEMLIHDNNFDSLKSVSPAPVHPVKMWTIIDKELDPVSTELRIRFPDPDTGRQFLTPVYMSNGAIDIVRALTLKQNGLFHTGRIMAFPMDYNCDIDTVADVPFAIEKMRKMLDSGEIFLN